VWQERVPLSGRINRQSSFRLDFSLAKHQNGMSGRVPQRDEQPRAQSAHKQRPDPCREDPAPQESFGFSVEWQGFRHRFQRLFAQIVASIERVQDRVDFGLQFVFDLVEIAKPNNPSRSAARQQIERGSECYERLT
jgi:hypothetical protein